MNVYLMRHTMWIHTCVTYVYICIKFILNYKLMIFVNDFSFTRKLIFFMNSIV